MAIKSVKRTLGRPRRRWKILECILEKRWKVVNWIHLAQDMGQRRALVNMVMNFRVS